jgi:Protein of unknown function (DUF2490)
MWKTTPVSRLAIRATLLAVVLLLSAQLSRAQARPPAPEADTQSWNDVQLAVPLGKPVDFVLLGTLRLGDNISEPVDERLGLGFNFKAGKYLTLFPSFLSIWMQPPGGRKVIENRLSFAATLRFPVGKFSLSDRNQLERRFRRPQGVSTRYRNRLQLDYALKGTPYTLFTSDEVFYDWSVNDWVRNRFSAGLSRKFNQHFTGDLYYMRQNDGRARPGDLHIIGTLMRFRL